MRISSRHTAGNTLPWPFTPEQPRTPPPDDAPAFNRVRGLRPQNEGYDRRRDLPKLIALWPAELTDETAAGRALVVRKLRRALRQERQRGVGGHWAYDLKRHAALHRAYKRELQSLGAAAGALAPDARGAARA